MNLCGSCDKDFSSIKGFDAHRVGVHEYTYSEGVAMTPMREDGRRCLSTDEIRTKGYEKNGSGRWHDPAASKAVRNRFNYASLS
jgi:hypothetical protein